MKNLCIKNLSLLINNKAILTNINISLQAQEFVYLAGPSGAGKSSLLRCILFFEPAARGQIFFDNVLVTPANIAWYRSKISYIPQSLPRLDMSVDEYLKFPFIYGANQHLETLDKQLAPLLAAFNLSLDILASNFASISGGEAQRIALIQALILDKDIILIDEVTAGLDSANSQKVYQYLSTCQKSILLVSHNETSQDFCQRQINIKQGKIYA